MKKEALERIILSCETDGSFWPSSGSFLEFLPTELEQLVLAKHRIITNIDTSHQAIIFKHVPEEVEPVYKDYEVVVSRLASKSVQFTVKASCEGEAGDLAVKAAENYDYNCQAEDTVGYEVEYVGYEVEYLEVK